MATSACVPKHEFCFHIQCCSQALIPVSLMSAPGRDCGTVVWDTMTEPFCSVASLVGLGPRCGEAACETGPLPPSTSVMQSQSCEPRAATPARAGEGRATLGNGDTRVYSSKNKNLEDSKSSCCIQNKIELHIGFPAVRAAVHPAMWSWGSGPFLGCRVGRPGRQQG